MRWTHIIPQRTREMIRAQLMRISNQRIYLRHKRRADLLITKAGIEFQPSENASKHILFIVIDCLRKDHLSLYGYKRKTTPFLDCFAEESLVFRDAIAPSSWTYPSVSSILSGLYPHHHGGIYRQNLRHLGKGEMPEKLSDDVLLLPQILRHGGFSTYLGTNIITAAFPFVGDFQTVSLPPIGKTPKLIKHYLRWQKSQRGRSFAYVQIGDPHQPLHAPEPYRSEFGQIPNIPNLEDWDYLENAIPGDSGFEHYRENRIKLYDAAIRYTDAQVERIIDELDSMGILDQMLIVITADHGEELWDHLDMERKYFYDPRPAYGAGHGHHLWQEIIAVPLIIRGPGIAAGEVEHRVSLIDIMPTVLENAGAKKWKTINLDGVNLFDEKVQQRMILSEEVSFGYNKAAVLNGRYKLYRSEGDNVQWLFDLESDPKEQYCLKLPEVEKELIGFLPDLKQGKRETIDVTEEVRSRLRDLGYID